LIALGAALLLISFAAIALLVWLRPAAQDWQQSLRLGPITMDVGIEKLIRLGSQHQVAALLDGRSLRTSTGIWRISTTQEASELICERCQMTLPALGPAPLRLDRVSLTFARSRSGYSGSLRLRADQREIAVPWTAAVNSRGADIDIHSTALPMADVVAVLGHDLPEVGVARVTGLLSLQMHLHLPDRQVEAQWTAAGFHIAGLGTERLLNAALPERCGVSSQRPISGWLPLAVIAAEDQTFRSHPGYDPRQISAALHRNSQRDALHGASTLTQQLARLLYTGDERSAQRKLRELLYAVEMEQTLGKGRILQLYLALAPWGQDVCGAENAARRYLSKSASAVTPAEAAWLASLLTNPDAQLRRVKTSGVDMGRTTRIVQAMRHISTKRRERAVAEIASLRPAA
jgi:hypothetical protein